MVELIPIEVTINGGGIDNKAIDGIAINYEVNAIPSASAALHEVTPAGSNKTPTENRRVLVTAEAEKMKTFQQDAFAAEAEQVSIEVKPFGHGYDGRVIGPARKIFSGYYNNSVQLVHEVEAANSYLPHIYSLANILNNQQNEIFDATYTNVFTMVKVLLEKRHKDFEQMIASARFKDPVSKKNIEQIHANNMSVFPIVKKILEDSESKGGATYNGFSGLPAEAKKQLNAQIFNVLKRYLFSTQSQFLPLLLQVAGAFQSFYVPPIKGDSEYGYFKSNREKVADGESVSLQITGVTMTSGKRDNRPLQQVIVNGEPPRLNNTENKTQNIYSFLGDNATYMVYPESPPKENGNNLSLAIPEWIPTNFYFNKPVAKKQPRELDIKKRIDTRSALAKAAANELVGPIGEIIKEFAETAYKAAALASYSAVVNCTVDFSLMPGRTYQVIDEDEGLLFTGFLQGTSHNITGLSSSLSASTTLVFTSVKFTNFNLPS